jgi:membrane protein insertase Oxa1/YidC/SpoIIIJ
MHYLTAVFAAFVPLAAALYLTVTVIWTLVQRALLRRRYPLPTNLRRRRDRRCRPDRTRLISPAAGSAR